MHLFSASNGRDHALSSCLDVPTEMDPQTILSFTRLPVVGNLTTATEMKLEQCRMPKLKLLPPLRALSAP